jgi:hypothetical protein
MFPWYLSQMEPFWIIISFAGLAVIFEKVKDKNKFWTALIVIAIIAGPAYFWFGKLTTSDAGKDVAANIEAVSYLKSHMKSGDTVGLDNIGIVGYYTGAYIVDFFGLINDYASGFYPIKDSCVDKTQLYSEPVELVRFTMPDWVILSGTEKNEPCFDQSKWFKSNYAKVYINGVESEYMWKKIKT